MSTNGSIDSLQLKINNESNQIDYVLVNELAELQYNNEREIFEKNLRNTGLYVDLLENTERERFVQIKAPKETLLQYCEIMKLRMPLKNFDNLTEQYSRNRNYLFDTDSDNFITPSIKYMIINFILEQTKFVDDNEDHENKSESSDDNKDSGHGSRTFDEDYDDHCNNFGISNLILKNAYTAAYPLHDDEERERLMKMWGINLGFFTFQPLQDLKNYFGIKIALYFAWLQFYNWMLVIASGISLIYFFVGILLSFSNRIGDEICNGNETFYMCPQCDKNCDIWNLKDICSHTTIVFILNNYITIFYTIIMAVWSAIYLNMWSQYSAKTIQKWGIVDGDDLLNIDVPTKQYVESKQSKNYLKRFPNIFLSISVVLFWVCIVLAVLIGMTFYRISLYTSEWLYGTNSQMVKSTIVEVTGAILDLISILVLNEVYSKVAYKLTKQELHRTQKQFEESLMWKFYVFWFINYYSSFFYIAFFKGRFAGTPHNYKRIFGYRQEECGSRGCIVDLFIQMAVVMIGDMTYNNLIEYVVPYIKKKLRSSQVEPKQDCEAKLICSPWIRDYKLLYWGSKETSMEYLEMVLQYGLVILFVTAFPLGPICALINNIIEIRMDAQNLITNFRRPVAQNVKNIGVWIPIMEMVVNLSVVTNAFIIAFTTNFIPDFIYNRYKQESQSYVDFSLSRIDTNDLDSMIIGNYSAFSNAAECRYVGYYNPPEHPHKYELSELYWHILAARLIFVLLFQYFVNLLRIIIKSFVPSVPRKLKSKIINQLKRTQKLIILEETKLAHVLNE